VDHPASELLSSWCM